MKVCAAEQETEAEKKKGSDFLSLFLWEVRAENYKQLSKTMNVHYWKQVCSETLEMLAIST